MMLKLFQFIRFGDNFNWRCTVYIQPPIWFTCWPWTIKDQKNEIHKKKWKLKFLPDTF